MKRSFYKRMLFAVSLTLITVFALYSFYYISRIQKELERRNMKDLEFASESLVNTINSKLQGVLSISNWIITNEELQKKLDYNYTQPYEYFAFYNYLTDFCDSMMELESSIRLITFFTPNESLKEDKKNVRSISALKSSPVFEEILAREGSAFFCMMRDAVGEEYFQYNNASSPDNICMLRMVDYKGSKNILMIEIKIQLLLNEFCSEYGKGMYVKDGEGNVVIYYKDGKDLWSKTMTNQEIQNLQNENIYFINILNNQWEMCLFVNRTMTLAEVNQNMWKLIAMSLVIIMVVLAANTFVIKRTSRQLLKLNEIIEKAYQKGSGEKMEEFSENLDEVEQVIHSFEHLMGRVEYLMNEVYKKEIQNKSMELELLHSQIKPHFLYNTLSSIASLARRYQDEKLMNMITSLSDLYRISLSRGKENITVEKEIEMTKSYLVIMENRFEDLIHVEFKVQESALNGLVPKILLQPFIENAINHAMRPEGVLVIVIDIRRVEEKLVFQIYDDGIGIEEEKVKELLHGVPDDSGTEHGYGIPNVQRRIKMYMGAEYGVEILSKKDVGTNVKIIMPYWEQ